MMNTKELCQFLNVVPQTLWRWRNQDDAIPHIKHGKTIRYDKNEVIQWLKEKEKKQ